MLVWAQKRQQRVKDSEQWACKELHVGCKRGVTDATEALARAVAVFD